MIEDIAGPFPSLLKMPFRAAPRRDVEREVEKELLFTERVRPIEREIEVLLRVGLQDAARR